MATTGEGCIKSELELEKDVCFMWATADFYYISISSPTLSALLNNKTNTDQFPYFKVGRGSSSWDIKSLLIALGHQGLVQHLD